MRITILKLSHPTRRDNFHAVSQRLMASGISEKKTLISCATQEIPENGDGASETARDHRGLEHPPTRPARPEGGTRQISAVRTQDRCITII